MNKRIVKKSIALIVSLAMLFSFAGCNAEQVDAEQVTAISSVETDVSDVNKVDATASIESVTDTAKKLMEIHKKNPVGFNFTITSVDMADEDAVKEATGLDDVSAIVEVAVAESEDEAYKALLMKMKSEKDAKDIEKNAKNDNIATCDEYVDGNYQD